MDNYSICEEVPPWRKKETNSQEKERERWRECEGENN